VLLDFLLQIHRVFCGYIGLFCWVYGLFAEMKNFGIDVALLQRGGRRGGGDQVEE